jgi:EmrB/QacA subfamily drug resistance transporter
MRSDDGRTPDDQSTDIRSAACQPLMAADRRRWYALGLLCLAFFIDTLGSTTVFPAGPAMQRGLGLTQAGLQWSFTAATLPGGALLLVGGRLSDVFGRRRMFMLGLSLLTLASLVCGWAPSTGVLLAARAAQGVAAGLLTPAALSLVTSTFPLEDQRHKALAAWSAVGGAGATAGLLLGGLVTVTLGWQWIFFINVPVGCAMLLLSPVLLREPPTRGGSRKIDLPGTVTITCAIALLVYTVTETSQDGWLDPRTLAGLCIVLALIAGFAGIESRRIVPMLPPGLLRSRPLLTGNLFLLTAGLSVDGMVFTLSLYSERVLRYSATQFGGIAAIMTASSIAAAPIAQHATTRFGPRRTGRAGLAMLSVSSAGLAVTTSPRGSPVAIAGCMLLFGLGMGFAFVPGTIASLTGVPEQDSGIAAGIQNISFSLGTTLGVAILSAVSAAVIHGLNSQPDGQGYAGVLVTGYRTAFICGALLGALGLAVSATIYRGSPQDAL